MSKNKAAEASPRIDAEQVTRAKRMVLSREESKSTVDSLFEGAKASRKTARGTMDKLLVQAPAAVTQSPFLQKEAVAKNVTAFFEKKAYLTEAQRRFPELLKVGSTETQPQKAPTKKPAGATPTKPIISGDAA